MQGEEMRAERVRIIALSRTRQLSEAAARTPEAYKRETEEYARAMYEILDTLPSDRLAEHIAALAESYGAFGMAEDAYIADSLMNIALSLYQDECGEQTICESGWDRLVEDYFRRDTASA